jgi:PAS domain S-box-containing protein
MITALIQNAALLISLSVFYGVFVKLKLKHPFVYQFIAGIWFGVIAIAGMTMPFEYGTGAFYDGRSIVLSLAGLFGGGITAMVAVVVSGIFRWSVGGAGVWAGLATIVTCAVTGLFFRKLSQGQPEKLNSLYLFLIGVIVHVVMLACQLLFPWPVAIKVIEKIWLPVLLVFPFGFFMMSALLGNIEKQVKGEKKIRDAESLYRTTFYSIGDAVITTDLKGCINSMNPVAEKLTGWTKADAAGLPMEKVFIIINELSAMPIEVPTARVLASQSTVNLAEDTLLISKDGNRIPVADSASPIKNDKGEITGAVIVFRDQTDDRLKKRLLEESESQFRSLFENHQAVHLLVDPDNGNILHANQAAADFYGWTIDELKQMNINQINTGSPEEIRKNMDRVHAAERFHFTFEHRIANGQLRDVELFSSKVVIKGKDYLHSIVHDVSEKKKVLEELMIAKEKAEESDRLKSAFLANMSHEIRTPLNGILGFTGLLTDEKILTEAKKKEYSNIINKSAESLMHIINDILDISKLESGQLLIENKTIELNKTLDTLHTLYTKKLADNGKDHIALNVLKPENKTILSTDENRLTQIFTNLLDNAMKFTHSGKIEFGVKSIETEKIQLMVSDTGIGIEKKRHNEIFSQFTQANESISQLYGGTGLGLSIVKKLIELMNGSIELDSEPDRGSTFIFCLPFEAGYEPIQDIQQEIISAEKVGSKKIRILIVEDDPVSRLYYEEILKRTPYELLFATTGAEALEMANHTSPRIILMDIRLPDISGMEVVKEIRKVNSRVKIIAQTAYAMASDEKIAMASGCNDFVTKPVSREMLLHKLKSLVIKES